MRYTSAGLRSIKTNIAAVCKTVATSVIAILASGTLNFALAQNFPERPVRVIVPVAAGGNQDIVARSLGQKLSEQMGQQFLVENRSSASGLVGTAFVAKALPDGYTYLAISNTFVAAPATVLSVSYDPVKDFSAVSLTARLPLVLLVHPSERVSSVKELIELAKKRPNELNYGSAGTGSNSHLAAELFNYQADIKMTHVPYKGGAPALSDIVGGHVVVLADTINTCLPFIRSGKLKALAVTSIKRSPSLTDIPTISESGLTGYELVVFNAMMAPSGTPVSIIRRMHSEISKAVQQSDMRERFIQQGVEIIASSSPEEASAFIKSETEKYARLVRAVGIKPE